MNTYKIQIAMSYWQTLEIEADSEEEAENTALFLFDVTQAQQGEGEVKSTTQLPADNDDAGLTRADLAQFYGPSVRI